LHKRVQPRFTIMGTRIWLDRLRLRPGGASGGWRWRNPLPQALQAQYPNGRRLAPNRRV